MTSVSVLILTYNEKPNIVRTLSALPPLDDIILIDSASTDGTPALAAATNSKVRAFSRAFDSHTAQWNFGLDQVETEWVLTLDADYELTPELRQELTTLNPSDDVNGYFAEFVYRIYGRSLRASSYPPRLVLFRTARGRYVDDGHTQLLKIEGRTEKLAGKIYHDDRKPLSHWIQAQDDYAKLEARHLLESGKRADRRDSECSTAGNHTRPTSARERKAESGCNAGEGAARLSNIQSLSIQDRLRLKIFFAAPAMFLYLMFVRGLVLDGWPGWFYVAQRTIAELVLSVRLLIEKYRLEGDGS